MAKVELKQPVIEEISAHIKDAQSVVLVDYRGLTVEQDTRLRKQLREAGITYKVYKNTMMNFAFKGTDFEPLTPYLEGPSAVAISKTRQLRPACSVILRRKRTSSRLRAAWLKESLMTLRESARLQRSRQERSCFPSCLEVCSHRSPIWHVF